MKDIAKIIGTRIKMLRFAKHMQQTELAKRMGISQTHMSNIESGRNMLLWIICTSCTKFLNAP